MNLTIADVRRADEPAAAPMLPVGRLAGAPSMSLDLTASPEQMRALLEQVQLKWQRLGAEQPHFSVITQPEYRDNPASLEGFYRTGLNDIDQLASFFDRSGYSLSDCATAIDFGSGVGRLSAALSTRLGRVYSVDISRPHQAVASDYFRSRHISNVEQVPIDSIDDVSSLPQVDLVFSLIVLQHNPPPVILELLKALATRVRSGGFIYFQVPTYRLGYRFSTGEYLADASLEAIDYEMHPLPQRFIFECLAEAGFSILEVHEDTAAGSTEMLSMRYFARRTQV